MPEFEDSRPFLEADALKPFVHTDKDSMSMQFDMSLIQSRMLLADPTALDLPYTQTMMAFLLLNPAPEKVLMVGLGGGSLPKYCHAHLHGADITVVEINPEVIALRDTFKVPPDGDRFRVVAGDGAAFVAKAAPASYDLILVDAFNYDGQPDPLASLDFYKACRKALVKPSGVLVVNLQDAEPECTRLVGRIWQTFGEPVMALDIECGGNRIVVAGTDEAFRACAAGFGQRWMALPVVHRDTLLESKAAIEYELEPWWPAKKPAKAAKPGKPGR
jgi:spermidine synthase